jgi:8-oxo-dGTP pyrophosphatase MutT (NUDIX family)
VSHPPRVAREETPAGGLVVDTAKALIGRYGRDGRLQWFLPKGHVEPDETIEEAAVREIEEETGRVLASLDAVDHSYHKTVHHHLLLAVRGSLYDAEVAQRLAHADERRARDQECARRGMRIRRVRSTRTARRTRRTPRRPAVHALIANVPELLAGTA